MKINYLSFVSFFCTIFLVTYVLALFNIHPDPSKDTIIKKDVLHRALYVDRRFNDDEFQEIVSAAFSWNDSTGGIVDFKVIRLPSQEFIDIDKSMMIVKINQDYPDIILMEGFTGNNILGYFNNQGPLDFVAIVDDRLSIDQYKAVVLHELGHSLGLMHNKELDGVGSLMYPALNAGADHITYRDLTEFCKIYKCNASKL